MKHSNTHQEPTAPSSKINVLIIIATDILSGPAKGLLQLLRYHDKEAFSFTICNFDATWMSSRCNDFFNEASKLAIPVRYIKQSFPLDPLMLPRAIRTKRGCCANIVQTHGYKPNVLGFLLKTFLGTPWLAFAHGYTDDNPKIRVYNLMDQMLLKHADRVVAVSDATKRLLVAKGIHSTRIAVIRNAIEPTHIEPQKDKQEMKNFLGIKSQTVVVGTVGRLNPEKGQIVFLEAFKGVLRQVPQAKAVIIGDGQDRKKLETYAQVNGISKDVIFTGHVSHVADYYQLMDLLVIPSYSEGLPNVLLEAMSFGIPVIATSVGGIPEIIKSDNGILVPPGNPRKLSEAMTGLFKDSGRLSRLKIHACESILSSIDPQERARSIMSLYHSLLKKDSGLTTL